MYERQYVAEIRKRLAEPRFTIISVTGPRQVGKTTLVRQALEGAQVPVIYENADGLARSADGWIADVWAGARRSAAGGTAVLVIDEIQKVAEWSEAVKREWDADTWNNVDVRVIVLGSSTVLLNKGLRESLAGRFERIRIPTWSFSEMKTAFNWNLETFAIYGGYPGSVPYIGDRERWMSYMMDSVIEPVILKDVLQLHRIDKPALLRELMLVGATMSSREVSYTKLLGVLHDAGNTSTVVHYLDLLEEAGVLCGLSKFSTSVITRRTSPKLQVFANGISTACGAPWSPSMNSDDFGRCYESLVGTHLRNLTDGTFFKLSWWRDGNDEVDFVIHDHRTCLAIEVSTGTRHGWRGIDAFRKKHPHSRAIRVGTDGISIESFLSLPLSDIMNL